MRSMGWLLKHRKKDNRWRIWTTVSDGWITDWLSESELKAELAARYEEDFKLKVIEAYMSFPNGWFDKDTHKRLLNQEGQQAYMDWNLTALRGDQYEEEI